MVNMSATGIIFETETHGEAEVTVREAIDAGAFTIPSNKLGRDIILGSTLAAMASMLREEVPKDYPEAIAGHILPALGVPHPDACAMAHLSLPALAAIEDAAAENR
jgi:hypothetical protein